MSNHTTITTALYSWPVSGSKLDEAISRVHRMSNLPLSNKVLIDRETLNTLVSWILFESKDAQEIRNGGK